MTFFQFDLGTNKAWLAKEEVQLLNVEQMIFESIEGVNCEIRGNERQL